MDSACNEPGLEAFSTLSAQLFAAAADPSQWPRFMAALSHASGGVSTHLVGHDAGAGRAVGVAYSHLSEDAVHSYLTHYAALNPWAKAHAQLAPGVPFAAEALCSRAQLERTEFWADWVRPQENIAAGGGMVLFRDHDRAFAIGGNIRRRDEARLQPRWMRLLTLLGPLMQHALEMNRALAGRSIELAARSVASGLAPPAVLVLDVHGHVRYANAGAQALLARGEGLRLTPHGALQLQSPHQARLVQALRALDGSGHASKVLEPLHLRLQTRGPQPVAFDVRGAPLEPDRLDVALPLSLNTPGQPCLLLTLTRCTPAATLDPATHMVRAWGVSPAEATVTALLAQGLTPCEIAAQREVSLHTVRAQIKSVLARTGARRQQDLLRRLWSELGTAA